MYSSRPVMGCRVHIQIHPPAAAPEFGSGRLWHSYPEPTSREVHYDAGHIACTQSTTPPERSQIRNCYASKKSFSPIFITLVKQWNAQNDLYEMHRLVLGDRGRRKGSLLGNESGDLYSLRVSHICEHRKRLPGPLSRTISPWPKLWNGSVSPRFGSASLMIESLRRVPAGSEARSNSARPSSCEAAEASRVAHKQPKCA